MGLLKVLLSAAGYPEAHYNPSDQRHFRSLVRWLENSKVTRPPFSNTPSVPKLAPQHLHRRAASSSVRKAATRIPTNIFQFGNGMTSVLRGICVTMDGIAPKRR